MTMSSTAGTGGYSRLRSMQNVNAGICWKEEMEVMTA